MKRADVEHARIEAIMFVEACQRVIDEHDCNSTALITGTKRTGALRRQSMELTRALAAMRNPK